MKTIVPFLRALGDHTRWRMVRLVMERPMCVLELAEVFHIPQSSASSHVQILRKAGLLEDSSSGKWTYFCIRPDVSALLHELMRHFDEDPVHQEDAKRAQESIGRRGTPAAGSGRPPRNVSTRNLRRHQQIADMARMPDFLD